MQIYLDRRLLILSGAGATFPSPFYNKLIKEYQKQNKTRIDYQAVGSGSGIKLLLDRKVDFGASDIFLSNQDLEKISMPVLHIPTCVGAVAIIYNLPGNPALKLDSELLAKLLMGEITHWSDRRIQEFNDLGLAGNMDVTVIHRYDSSGTTFILTYYLSKTNGEWNKKISCGKKVKWVAGMGAKGNGGVAEMVSKVPGSIGYVSLNYAEEKRLPVAALRNRSGHFIKPKQDSVSLAADVTLPEDCRLLITNTIAHDFNNILAAIIGYTELCKLEYTVHNQIQSYLEQILQAGMRARDLVSQILTFSHQKENNKGAIEVRYCIKEALKLMQATISSNIEIRRDIQQESGISELF